MIYKVVVEQEPEVYFFDDKEQAEVFAKYYTKRDDIGNVQIFAAEHDKWIQQYTYKEHIIDRS